MTHEEYWDYYADMTLEIEIRFPSKQGWSDEHRLQIAEKTISPYHYWLENKALTTSTAKGSSENSASMPNSPPQDDPSNLFAKAQEIRSKARAGIKKYMEHKISSWSSAANLDLWSLAADWAKGQSIYKALDSIPDSELVKWNQKHEVFE